MLILMQPNNENFKWMLKNANKPSSVMGKNANAEYVLANGYIVRPKQEIVLTVVRYLVLIMKVAQMKQSEEKNIENANGLAVQIQIYHVVVVV